MTDELHKYPKTSAEAAYRPTSPPDDDSHEGEGEGESPTLAIPTVQILNISAMCQEVNEAYIEEVNSKMTEYYRQQKAQFPIAGGLKPKFPAPRLFPLSSKSINYWFEWLFWRKLCPRPDASPHWLVGWWYNFSGHKIAFYFHRINCPRCARRYGKEDLD